MRFAPSGGCVTRSNSRSRLGQEAMIKAKPCLLAAFVPVAVAIVYLLLRLVISHGELVPSIEDRSPKDRIPELPTCSGQPDGGVCVVSRRWDADLVRLRLEGNDFQVWTEADQIIFACRRDAERMFLNGGLQTLMGRIRSTDLWIVAIRIVGLPEAALSYSFVDPGKQGADIGSDIGQDSVHIWRGPDAPPEPAYNDPLQGSLVEHTLGSVYLKTDRRITVYVPPQHQRGRELPCVYMADGHMLADFARFVEPLIESGALPPLLLVGVHAADPRSPADEDLRAAEYLEVAGSARFGAHMRFFTEEVTRWCEDVYQATTDPTQRVVFGVSNGAAFVLSLGLSQPSMATTIVAFSVAGGQPTAERVPPLRCYLLAGTLETAIHRNTAEWATHLSESEDVELVFRARVAGHDRLLWREELPRALLWVFRATQTDGIPIY